MASLLRDPLLEISGRAPPPNKTFYYFAITKSEVIWRWWKISLRVVDRNTRPGEVKESHQELLQDYWLQNEITIVFGQEILEYAKSLCQGHFNYLEQLSDSLLLRIINYLELEDVGQLGRTSRRFWQLCRSQEFWEKAVRQRCNTLSDDVASLATEISWRRIFFTNKLQLQMLIHRQRTKLQEQLACIDQDSKSEPTPGDKSLETKDGKSGSSISLSISSKENQSGDSLSPIASLDSDKSPSCCSCPYSDITTSPEDDPEHSMIEVFMEDLKKFKLPQSSKEEMEGDDFLPELEKAEAI